MTKNLNLKNTNMSYKPFRQFKPFDADGEAETPFYEETFIFWELHLIFSSAAHVA
jgi:hypothetical protein